MALVRAGRAAEILGLSRQRLYEEVRAGRLPGAVRIGVKSLRFDQEELESFIRRGGVSQSLSKYEQGVVQLRHPGEERQSPNA
jgi:excisionase family DNA binding protein